LQQLLQRRAGGRPVVDRQTRLGDFLEEWISGTLPQAVRRSTAVSYAFQLRQHVVPVLGRRPLAKLTAADVQRWQAGKLAEGLSPRTVQYQHAILRRALGQAERWGLVGHNVAAVVAAPRPAFREVQPLSVEEARTLLATAADDRLYALWAVALAVGLRRGEALALRWCDIDLDAGTLRVARTVQRIDGKLVFAEPKTARSRRTVPLPPVAVAALRGHRDRPASGCSSARHGWTPGWCSPRRSARRSIRGTCSGRSASCAPAPASGECASTTCGTPARRCCSPKAWSRA
jgi:integrase